MSATDDENVAGLYGLLAHAVAQRPDAIALACDGVRVSYAELHRRVLAVSALLRGYGVGAGERVVIHLDNGPHWIAGLMGVLHAGAVAVPVNPLVRAPRLASILGRSGASVLLTQQSLSRVWAAARGQAPALHTVVAVDAAGLTGSDARPWPEPGDPGSESPGVVPTAPVFRNPDDLALLLFTSGSTGEPKGVMHSQASLLAALASIRGYLPIASDDVVLSALPLSFGYGLTQWLLALDAGATLALERSFAFPVRFLDAAVRERATVVPGVPTMFATLLALGNRERFDLRAVRLLTSAAAALPPALAADIGRWLPDARLFVMYGQTECIRISYLPPEELARRPGSVGRGMPGQRWWLADDQGRPIHGPVAGNDAGEEAAHDADRDAGPGTGGGTGELVVEGPHVMLGYWSGPDDAAPSATPSTARFSGERVLRTGDLFRLDADGFLHFVARRDDLIKTRGEKVSPTEVEHTILELPGVAECAVIGVHDPLLGEAVKAFVVARAGATLDPQQIVRHCLGRLESWMAPRTVAIVEALPRTDNGKILRPALRGPDSPTPQDSTWHQ